MKTPQKTIENLQALRLGIDEAIDLTHDLSAGELMGLLEPETPPRLRAAAATVLHTICMLQMILEQVEESFHDVHHALGLPDPDVTSWPQVAARLADLTPEAYERLVANGELHAQA